jgi:ubiquinone biosynthesis protein COQ4
MELALFRPGLDEHGAEQILSRGGLLARIVLGVRAAISLARNPNDTAQVFILARALDRESLPRLRAKLARSEEGRELLARRPAIDSRHVDFAALRALPAETLGGAYARMLERNELDPDLFTSPGLADPELDFVAQRVRQTHDLWHVVTGLSTDVPSEIALQAFTYAQLHQRFSRLIAVGGALHFSLRYRGLIARTRRWYHAGRKVPFLLAVPWESWWQVPLAEVRARLGIVPEAA